MSRNVYLVLSEPLEYVEPILDDGSGPKVPYAIYEVVSAPTRSRAKWLAWCSDRESFSGDVRDMPRFTVRLVARDVVVPEGLLPRDSLYFELAAELPDVVQPGTAKRKAVTP